MPFNILTKVLIVLCLCTQISAQNDSVTKPSVSKYKLLHDASRQRLLSFTIEYQLAMPVGDNFIGDSFEARNGLGFSAHFYVFKNFFIGYSNSNSKFKTNNINLLGNYKHSSIYERYMSVGYEFLPFSKVRLGAYFSMFGKATLSNDIEDLEHQKDTGQLRNYGLRLEYEITKNFSLITAYNWRLIKTNIEAPSSLQDYFEEGRYHSFNLGLKFNFGKHDLSDRLRRL